MQGGKWQRLLMAALVAALLAIPAMAQQNLVFSEYFEGTEDFEYRVGPDNCELGGQPLQGGAEDRGWIFEGPWQLVDECAFWGDDVPAGVVSFSGSYLQAAYFGYPDPDKGTGDYCDATASDPTLTSPEFSVQTDCQVVSVTFDYYRQVESDPGEYDKTWAELQFYSDAEGTVALGAPLEIFYMDSGDKSEDEWQTAEFSTIPGHPELDKPSGAVSARVLFHFDPVDKYNNCFFGWLIDDIEVYCGSVPLSLNCDNCPSSLPQGQAGTKYGPYDFKDCVTGGYVAPDDSDGLPDYRFSIAKLNPRTGECMPLEEEDPSPLPERLTLTQDGVLEGNLEPDSSGTYTFWVLVKVGVGRDETTCCKQYTLAVRSDPGEGAWIEHFDGQSGVTWMKCGFETIATPPNLWHEVSSFACDEGPTSDDPDVTPSLVGYGTVAWFGHSDTCDYDKTHKRVKGCYCATVPEQWEPGLQIYVGFKSYRVVEEYAGGYDKTYVELSVDGGKTWKLVQDLYWDSTDPSTPAWTWEQANSGIVTGKVPVQVRFCFDSVDGYGNEYFGWAIDEVTVWVEEAELAIDCCPLPEAFVGEPYTALVGYAGGASGARVLVTGLPDGLAQAGSGVNGDPYRIIGKPRPGTEGTYPVTIQVLDGEKVLDTRICDLIVNEQVCFFFEDFEADPIWAWTGQWVRVGQPDSTLLIPQAEFTGTPPCDPEDIPVGEGNHVAYYGNPATMVYETVPAARTTGMLSLLDVPAGIPVGADCPYILLTFDSFRRVEQYQKGFDRTKVQVRWDTGPQWYTVWYKDSGDVDVPAKDECWMHETANNGIAFAVAPGATKMWVRFVFDSVDRWYNNYFGWMIDNIKICCAQDGGPIAPDLQGKGLDVGSRDGDEGALSVMNVPNPVRDVHTTTFTVRGVGVEAIRIQIFDINEALVFEQEAAGDELVWHTDNNYGEYLANGVYFYRAFAMIDGVWVQTKFQKLVILR